MQLFIKLVTRDIAVSAREELQLCYNVERYEIKYDITAELIGLVIRARVDRQPRALVRYGGDRSTTEFRPSTSCFHATNY